MVTTPATSPARSLEAQRQHLRELIAHALNSSAGAYCHRRDNVVEADAFSDADKRLAVAEALLASFESTLRSGSK
jgi:hypothetical protein